MKTNKLLKKIALIMAFTMIVIALPSKSYATATMKEQYIGNMIDIENYILNKQYEATSIKANNVWSNVISHELGHALGLDDNPGNTGDIMNYSYDVSIGYKPERGDVAGIYAYPVPFD